MRRGKTCPGCHEHLEGTPTWWGFVRTFPSRCPHCECRLAYDTAGGIYVLPANSKD